MQRSDYRNYRISTAIDQDAGCSAFAPSEFVGDMPVDSEVPCVVFFVDADGHEIAVPFKSLAQFAKLAERANSLFGD